MDGVLSSLDDGLNVWVIRVSKRLGWVIGSAHSPRLSRASSQAFSTCCQKQNAVRVRLRHCSDMAGSLHEGLVESYDITLIEYSSRSSGCPVSGHFDGERGYRGFIIGVLEGV